MKTDNNISMPKILVVVDMQNNFIRDSGAEAIIPKVIEKIKDKSREGYEIILTLDKSGGATDGRISSECDGARFFKKHSYGCEELIAYLKERNPDVVEFAGICTDICLITNVLSTITVLPFADVVVDSGCCASQSADGHNCALRVMKSCNIKVT